MDAIYPQAKVLLFQGESGGSYVDAPYRGVLHTTDAVDYTPSTTSYYGHSNPPHFTVAKKNGTVTVYQHYSIKVAARALKNLAGGVQTNRMCAIQIEIAWQASNIKNLPADMKSSLKQLMNWISAQGSIKKKSPKFYDADQAYGFGSVSRMSFSEWNSFNGWCGHQHVPENDHWDPGLIDINYLLGR